MKPIHSPNPPWPVRVCALLLSLCALPAQADGLSAEHYLAEVISRNPGYEALRHAQAAAQAAVVPAAALDDPMLAYSLAPQSLDTPGLDTGYSVMLSQKLPWPGKRAQRRKAAQWSAQAAAARLDLAQRDLRLQARQLLAEWDYLAAALRIHAQQIRSLKAAVSSARARYASAASAPQAVLAAELQLQQRQAQGLQLQARQQEVTAGLNALRAKPSDTALALRMPPLWSAVDAELGELDEHPRLRQLAALDSSRGAAQREAELAWRPDLQLSASYVATAPREENRARIGVALNLPFGNDKRHQRLQQVRAEQANLQAQWQQVHLQLQRERTAARAALASARDQLRLYQNGWLQLAQTRWDAAQAAYASGRSGFADWHEADEAQLQVRLGQAQAQRDALHAQARLIWLGQNPNMHHPAGEQS